MPTRRASLRSPGIWLAAAIGLLAGAAWAAPPVVPATLNYQGLLLDPAGDPRTGTVSLTVRLYDSVIFGTLLYKQSFSGVALADGVFSVQLGPTGESTDSPANPLTTSLAAALAGDVGTVGSSRFVELTVGSEGTLSRTQIVSSAYALRATSAASADTAATATTAQNATQVGGLSSAFVTELWEHSNLDGGEPPNTDTREGLGDVDGDGIANFIDADNDGDGIADPSELTQGSDINLVTPTVTNASPPHGLFDATSTVGVTGTNFQPGLSVVFGSETPAPTNVTPTGFQVQVGPQPVGPVDVSVTLPNGQSDTLADAFEFITSGGPHSVNVTALQTALDVRPASLDMALAGVGEYGIGTTLGSTFGLASIGFSQIAVTWKPTGVLSGVRCRSTSSSTCAAELLADSNSNFALEPESGTLIETLTSGVTTPSLGAASLEYDPAGRPVVGYVKRVAPASAALARDLDGDGDFDGTGERITIEGNLGGAGVTAAALALDSTGRAAYVYRHAGANALRVAWDRNGDGDFGDTVGGNPELFTLASVAPVCIGAAFDGADRLAVVYGASAAATVARDLSADGDFGDAGESAALPGNGAACDVAGRPGEPLAAVTTTGSQVELHRDLDGDGAFEGGSELTTFAGGAAALALALADDGTVAIATHDSVIAVP
jgi:hypothetical protein